MPNVEMMTVFGRKLEDVKFALDEMESMYGEGWTQKSVEQRKLGMKEIERIVLLQADKGGK